MAENLLLFISVLAFLPVAASILGLLLLAPLMIGLRKSLKTENSEAINVSSGRMLIVLVASLCAALYLAKSSSDEATTKYNELAKYQREFPYKVELGIYNNMGAGDFSMKYGEDARVRMTEIFVENLYKTRYLNSEFREADDKANLLNNICIVVFFYFMVVSLCWAWPLSNKVEAGEIMFVTKESRIKKKGIIIGSEGLKRYSTADELLKWANLRDKGVISDDEYEVARNRLIGDT